MFKKLGKDLGKNLRDLGKKHKETWMYTMEMVLKGSCNTKGTRKELRN